MTTYKVTFVLQNSLKLHLEPASFLLEKGFNFWTTCRNHFKDGIPISFTVELRDTGNFGFALPESQIRATAEENIEGIRKVYEHIRPGSEIIDKYQLYYLPACRSTWVDLNFAIMKLNGLHSA